MLAMPGLPCCAFVEHRMLRYDLTYQSRRNYGNKSSRQASGNGAVRLFGAGKTTILSHILNNSENKKVAVIVNNLSEINIDSEILRSEVSLNRSEEKLVEMSNGCICCTLRKDFLEEVTKMAKEGRFDYLVNESTGISEPFPVAETLTLADENEVALSDIADLESIMTVVDAVNFLKN